MRKRNQQERERKKSARKTTGKEHKRVVEQEKEVKRGRAKKKDNTEERVRKKERTSERGQKGTKVPRVCWFR